MDRASMTTLETVAVDVGVPRPEAVIDARDDRLRGGSVAGGVLPTRNLSITLFTALRPSAPWPRRGSSWANAQPLPLRLARQSTLMAKKTPVCGAIGVCSSLRRRRFEQLLFCTDRTTSRRALESP
jgi:hypothetical protein